MERHASRNKVKRRSYFTRILARSFRDVSLDEVLAEMVGGLMVVVLGTVINLTERKESSEIMSLGVVGAIAFAVAGFLIRLIFVTPSRMHRELEEKFDALQQLKSVKDELGYDLRMIQDRLGAMRSMDTYTGKTDQWRKNEWQATVKLFDQVERHLREALTEAEASLFYGADNGDKVQLPRPESEDGKADFIGHVQLLTAKRDALKRIIEGIET